MRIPYIVCGLLTLLLSAYLDNSRGPLLPLFVREFGISYERTSWFLVIGNFFAAAATAALVPLLPRFGLRRISLFLYTLSVGTAVFSLAVGPGLSLDIFAIALGVSISGLGTICNLFVIEGTDEHHRARFLCGLHMMYGFGSLLAPLAIGFLLRANVPWPGIYLLLIPPLLGVAVMISRAADRPVLKAIEKQTHRTFGLTHLFILALTSIYVVGEVMTSMWMATYLVEVRKITLENASLYVSAFFLVMGVTRGLFMKPIPQTWERAVMAISLLASAGFAVLGQSGFPWALPLCGVFGPFFPIFLARMSRTFPKESAALTTMILAAIQLTLGFSHLLMGRSIRRFGVATTYFSAPVVLILTVLVFLVFCGMENRQRLHRHLK